MVVKQKVLEKNASGPRRAKKKGRLCSKEAAGKELFDFFSYPRKGLSKQRGVGGGKRVEGAFATYVANPYLLLLPDQSGGDTSVRRKKPTPCLAIHPLPYPSPVSLLPPFSSVSVLFPSFFPSSSFSRAAAASAPPPIPFLAQWLAKKRGTNEGRQAERRGRRKRAFRPPPPPSPFPSEGPPRGRGRKKGGKEGLASRSSFLSLAWRREGRDGGSVAVPKRSV